MEQYQSLLFPYAYNILGSVEDAKDAVQDVLLKYTAKGRQADNEKNYLIRGVINQSINLKTRKREIQPPEDWLPEPIATEKTDLALELRELVSYSLLYLLERLNPKERAVFILKEAFSYRHEEIAEVLSISTENSRKLYSRSVKKVRDYKADKPLASYSKQLFETIDQFTDAIQSKDLDKLHQLMSDDISFHADGGDKVRVVSKHSFGIREVADLLVFVYHKFQRNYTTRKIILNHQPALLYFDKKKLILCQIFEFTHSGKVENVSLVIDPVKLKHLIA